jgi:hypothetical protein
MDVDNDRSEWIRFEEKVEDPRGLAFMIVLEFRNEMVITVWYSLGRMRSAPVFAESFGDYVLTPSVNEPVT